MTPFVRNTLTSIFTTALDFGTLTGLVELAHVDYVVATFVGTVVGATSNFIINRHWSFAATHVAWHGQALKMLPVQAGSSALQTLGVWLFTRFGRVPYMASKLIVSVLVYLGWNYPMNKHFVFASRGEPAGTSRTSSRGATPPS